MKTILNKTKKSSDRYTLINEGMSGHSEPKNSPLHNYSVANGVDRGYGYQGYTSINYFLEDEHISNSIKLRLRKELKKLGFDY